MSIAGNDIGKEFLVKDSFAVLLIVFLVALFFAILLCYYPGPEFLGSFFLPMLALPSLLALGCGIKLVFRKPIVKVNDEGIYFSRSAKFIPWPSIKRVWFSLESQDEDAALPLLKVRYLNQQHELTETAFALTGSMDKTETQMMNAIEHFSDDFKKMNPF